MIKRIYVNNYRALVNFEMQPGEIDVLCGTNGTGKSSIIDAVRFICSLASGRSKFTEDEGDGDINISQLQFTSWLDSRVQTFEMDISSDGREFCYKIELEQLENHCPRVSKESAVCNGQLLYTRDLDGVHLDGGSSFSLDWRQAALPMIAPSAARKNVEYLQKAISRIVILRPDVHLITAESRSESRALDLNMGNFVSWYRLLSQEQDYTDALRDCLKIVWTDMRSLLLENTGTSAKLMKLRFESADLSIDQLSDGERMLLCLYAVQTALQMSKMDTLILDEPDNFVSLQEIQPWFIELAGDADETHQALIVTHNGEILNAGAARKLLAARDGHGAPVRIAELATPEGMMPSEALSRGWGGENE